MQTVRFKNELERNITIKLGYANAKIYRAADPAVPRPWAYKAYGSSKEDAPACDVPGYEGTRMELLRHVSFVDCPGHDILMATMLNGAAVMDGALLLVAANEACPQPQTSEHLAAVEIMRLKHIIILQNKIDLISESAAANQHDAIVGFVQGTIAEGAPVVPISAQLKYNVDAVCEYIVKKVPVPVRDFVSPPQMIVIRSFDVNKPGSEVDDLKGGVAGGSILQARWRGGVGLEGWARWEKGGEWEEGSRLPPFCLPTRPPPPATRPPPPATRPPPLATRPPPPATRPPRSGSSSHRAPHTSHPPILSHRACCAWGKRSRSAPVL